jgi:hypothetical protein
VKDGRIARLCFFVLVLILTCAGNSSAQLFPGRVTGVVRDTQGAAIPDAGVKLRGTLLTSKIVRRMVGYTRALPSCALIWERGNV